MATNANSSPRQYGKSVDYLDDVLERQLATIAPQTIVDFGAGEGKNGKILKNVLGDSVHTVAVEGFQPTVDMLLSSGIYNEVHHDLIQNWLESHTEHYDLAIFGDVLEHLSVREIRKVMMQCLKQFDCIIAVVPLCHIFQDEVYGNKLEIHKSYITESFFNRYHPEEKHIKAGGIYTIMNVKILSHAKKTFTLRQTALGFLHCCVPFLQPIGLARPFATFIRYVGRKLGWVE